MRDWEEGERRDIAREGGGENRQTLEGGGEKSTWLPVSAMSAASRLVAIHYPAQLKYYAH